MTNLPTKTPKAEVEDTQLGDRFRDLLHDFWDEGKDIERELEPKVLPALKRLRDEVVKLIEKIEGRTKKPD
jgi:hypothetical protein